MSLYFIQEDEDGPIKIGWTNMDVAARMAAFQTGNSHHLRLLGELDLLPEYEKFWHGRFERFQKKSEWFWPAPELLDAIKEAVDAQARGDSPIAYSGKRQSPDDVRKWISDRGMTLAGFARLTGFNASYVSKSLTQPEGCHPRVAVRIEIATKGDISALALLRDAEERQDTIRWFLPTEYDEPGMDRSAARALAARWNCPALVAHWDYYDASTARLAAKASGGKVSA